MCLSVHAYVSAASRGPIVTSGKSTLSLVVVSARRWTSSAVGVSVASLWARCGSCVTLLCSALASVVTGAAAVSYRSIPHVLTKSVNVLAVVIRTVSGVAPVVSTELPRAGCCPCRCDSVIGAVVAFGATSAAGVSLDETWTGPVAGAALVPSIVAPMASNKCPVIGVDLSVAIVAETILGRSPSRVTSLVSVRSLGGEVMSVSFGVCDVTSSAASVAVRITAFPASLSAVSW